MIYLHYIRESDEFCLTLEGTNEEEYAPIEINGLDQFGVIFNTKMPNELVPQLRKVLEFGWDFRLQTSASNKDRWVCVLSDTNSSQEIKSEYRGLPYLAIYNAFERFESQLAEIIM